MKHPSAHALKERGHKVLCIDLDPQGNLSLLFDIKKTDYSIHHLMINSIRQLKQLHNDVLWTELVQEKGGVDILCADQDLSGFELTVAGINSPRQLILKQILEKSGIIDQYDYIVIDAPPTLGLLVVNILCATDGVLVPFRPDEFYKAGLEHMDEVIGSVEDMGIGRGPEILGYIPNLVDLRRKQERDDLEKISSMVQLKGKVVSPFFNRTQLVKAQAKRLSVFNYKSKEFGALREQFTEIALLVEELS